MTKVYSIQALRGTNNIPNKVQAHYAYDIYPTNITPKTVAGAPSNPEFARKIISKPTTTNVTPVNETTTAAPQKHISMYFVTRRNNHMTNDALAKYFDNARNAAAIDSEIWTMGVVAELEQQPETVSNADIRAFVEPRRIAANAVVRETPAKPETKFYDEPATKKKMMAATGQTIQDYIRAEENDATREEINDFIITRFLKKRNRIRQAFASRIRQRVK